MIEVKYNDLMCYARSGSGYENFTELKELNKGLYRYITFSIFSNEDIPAGSFMFYPMPGCCGIVVSTGTYLHKQFRGGQLSRDFRVLKERIAKELGYSCMIATTKMDDIPARKNMEKGNYKFVEEFVNSRTGNRLGIGGKLL